MELQQTQRELTTEGLAHLIGGQLTVINADRGHLYRGEISHISVEYGIVKVKPKWFVRNRGGLSLQGLHDDEWVSVDTLSYDVISRLCLAYESTDGCFAMVNTETLDHVLFFPPNDWTNLDPAQVEGLNLAP